MKQQVFLGQVSAAGLLLTVSALFYSRVFDGPGWVGPVIGGLLVSAAIAVVLGRTGMTRVPRAIALFLAGIIFVGLTAILPGTNFGTADEIGSAFFGATIDGWRNSLAATLPINTAIPEPLGFITTVAWIVGATTGVLITRSDKTASPVIPPVMFAALSLPLGAPTGVVAYFFIAALVGSALLLALVRAVPQSQISGPARDRVTEFVGERMLSERLIGGGPILIVLALLAPLVALVLPIDSEEPFDPRRLRAEEVVTASAVNPLAEIKSQREAAEESFQLTLPAAPPSGFFDRLSLVSLENYDGANWTTDSTYSATSADISPQREVVVASTLVRQQIEIIDESSPWLPAGQPVSRIEGNDVWYDEESGSLLDRSGNDTRMYTIESRIAAPSPEELRDATVDRTEARYTLLPNISAESPLTALTGRIEGQNDFDSLTALEEFLRNEFTFVPDEASGTSIGRVEEFLTDGEGYRDQFVAAFAIAARERNFPTRITVGYRITEETSDGTFAFLDNVLTSNYDAWPEVLFEGIGWVAFDPVPTTIGEAGASGEDATQIPEGQPAPQGPSPTPAEPTPDDQLEDGALEVTATVRLLVVSGLFLLVFPILLMLMVVLAKLVRRRYRKNLDDPTERVLAAWQESKDRLLEAGIDVRPDMTVKEIVSASRKELGVHASSSLSTLAPYVTTTIYSERTPGDAAAEQVWTEVDTFDRQLSESRSRGQNIKAKIDPRPLIERV